MSPYVDIPFFIVMVLLFYIGWLKGFWRTMLGPISLLLGVMVSYIYYFETHKFLMSVVISIVAPFVFNFLFNYILGLLPKKKHSEEMSFFFVWNHMLGGILHSAWHGIVILLILFSIVALPLDFSIVRTAKAHITQSLTYKYLLGWAVHFLPGQNNDIEQLATVLQNPDSVEQMRGTKEYDELMADNRVKSIIQDESLVEQIQNKDYMQLIQNKKIMELMGDPVLIKKFMRMQKRMISNMQDDWATPKRIFYNN